jgi:hypothetical protein
MVWSPADTMNVIGFSQIVVSETRRRQPGR